MLEGKANMENNEKELEEREIKELELMNENENREFYVYLHIRLDNNTVFYVGKGKGSRCDVPKRNLHHDNICKTCGCKVVKIKENLTESQAYRLESKMIKYYVHTLGYGIDIEGYDDYDHNLPHLTNRDWGGEGGKSGIKFSEEHKQNLSKSHKGKPSPNKGKKMSAETKKKQSESHKGKLSKKVICITTGKTFNSIADATINYNVPKSNIVYCCKGKRNYAGKLNGVRLQWKYLEDDGNESKAV